VVHHVPSGGVLAAAMSFYDDPYQAFVGVVRYGADAAHVIA